MILFDFIFVINSLYLFFLFILFNLLIKLKKSFVAILKIIIYNNLFFNQNNIKESTTLYL
jgi:hypothetical protein